MKKFSIILLVVCTIALAGITILAGSSDAASIEYDSFSEVQDDINKHKTRKAPTSYKYSIKCPKCKVKNYYRQGQLHGNKIYCTNCGYGFRPGIISNRGQKVKPLKKSNNGGVSIIK